MWYLGNRMTVTSGWVSDRHFPFPLSGDELVGFLVASNTISRGTRTEWACQGLGRVFTLLSLSDGQSSLEVVIWFLPRCWVLAGRAKIGKELSSSHQPRSEPVICQTLWLQAATAVGRSIPAFSQRCPSLLRECRNITKLWAGENPAVPKPSDFSQKWPKFIQLLVAEGLTVNMVVLLGLNFMILKVLSHLNNLGFYTLKNPSKQQLVPSHVSEVLNHFVG